MEYRCGAGSLGRTILSAILLLSIAVAVAAQQPATVKLWNYNVHDKKFQQKMYKLFNQRNPNIRIEYSSIVINTYPQVLEAAAVAKEMPDLFYMASGSILTLDYLRTRKLIMPLSDCAPSEAELKAWMSQFPPNLMKFVEGVSVFDGKPYVIDLAPGSQYATYGILPLFYNKTLFKEAGIQKPPATFSEFRQIAAKVTSAGAGKYFGAVRGGRHGRQWDYDVYQMAEFAGHHGFWTPDRKTGYYHFSSPELKLALDVWINMREDGSVFPGVMQMEDEQAKMTFATNKAALQFGGPWNIGGYTAYNPDCDFDQVLPPVPDTGRKGYFEMSGKTAGAGGYVVASSSKNPKAVWEVIKFISSLEYQAGYVQGGFGVSYLPAANTAENFAGQPQMYKYVTWSDDPSYFRIVPMYSENANKMLASYLPPVYPPAEEVVSNVYQGSSGYEAFKDLDKRLDAAFDEGIAKAQAAGVTVTRADFAFPDWDPDKDYVPRKK